MILDRLASVMLMLILYICLWAFFLLCIQYSYMLFASPLLLWHYDQIHFFFTNANTNAPGLARDGEAGGGGGGGGVWAQLELTDAPLHADV